MKKLFATALLVCFVVLAYCADINPSPNSSLNVTEESTLRLSGDLTLNSMTMTYWKNRVNFSIVSADGNPHTLHITGNVSINGAICLVLGAGITLDVAGDISVSSNDYLHIESEYGSSIIANNLRGGSGPIRINGALDIQNELRLAGGNNMNLYLGSQSCLDANNVYLSTAGIFAGNGFTCNSLTINGGNTSQLQVAPGSKAVVNGPINVTGSGSVTIQGELEGETLNMSGGTSFNANANSKVSFDGDVAIGYGASLEMGDGAQFNVEGDCKFVNPNNVVIADGASLDVTGDVVLSNGRYTINGDLSVGNDLILDWTNSVSGDGSVLVINELQCGKGSGDACMGQLAEGGFNITHFNPVVTSSPLPIELVDFSATSTNGKVVLQWQTATETNNDYFTLYRSTNGDDFQEIAILNGAGNTNMPITYKYADFGAPQGTVYYRLDQTDYDGTSVTSKIVSVNHKFFNINQISLYPNPLSVNQSLMLNIGAEVQSPVSVTILNVAGVQVAQSQIENIAGDVALDIQLTPGVYIANISVLNETIKVLKLVVK